MENQAINHLLKELGSRYAIPRKKAIAALAEIGTPAVIHLIQALKHGTPATQAGAAEALDRIGTRVAKAAAEHWRMLHQLDADRRRDSETATA
jgi:HEAT repeat protein